MIKKVILAVFVVAIVFNGCKKEQKDAKNDVQKTQRNNKEFQLTTIDGDIITIQAKNNGFVIKGDEDKIVIFDIFATWCPPCRAEAVVLSSLEKKYKNKLEVIGITVESVISNEKLKEFARKYHANYILVNSQENRNLINAINKNLQVGERFGIPLMAMYKDGKLINYYQGSTEEEFIQSDIKKVLK